MVDIHLLFFCILIIGGIFYWMIKEITPCIVQKNCDTCGANLGFVEEHEAYYCSFECAAYDFAYSINKEDYEENNDNR